MNVSHFTGEMKAEGRVSLQEPVSIANGELPEPVLIPDVVEPPKLPGLSNPLYFLGGQVPLTAVVVRTWIMASHFSNITIKIFMNMMGQT